MPTTPEQAYEAIERTFTSGDLTRAQHEAEQALSQYAAKEPAWGAQFTMELAKILQTQGKSTDVVALLQPFPKATAKSTEVWHQLLLTLAQGRLGNEALSDQAYVKAEALHPEGALAAEMVGVEGKIALDRDHLARAEQLLQTALQQARAASDRFLQARMWITLGVVALHQEHYEDALTRFHQASSLAEAIGARFLLVKTTLNLGWVYYQTGEFAKALKNMQSAEARAQAIGASLDEAQALTNEGMIQARMGDAAAALAAYQRALALAETLHDQDRIGDTQLALAYLQLHTDLGTAAGHVRAAAAIYGARKDSAEAKEVALLEGLLLVEQGKTVEAKDSLLTLERRAGDAPWLRWEAENTLATVYAASSQQGRANRWFERAIATFERQRHSVESVDMQLPYFENGSDLYLSYMEHLVRQRRTDQALLVLDRSRAEMLAEGLHRAAGGSDAPLRSPRAVAARLHGTILAYCLRPGRSYLWAINAKRERFLELPGSETVLPMVKRHAEAILASKDLLAQKDSTGAALYNALVRPAEALLTPDGRVFLIPDKGLSSLNFETLIPSAAQPHYWIEDVCITNARSLRLLAASDHVHTKAHAERKILLIGDPVYRADEYAPLPNAAAEIAGLAAPFALAARSIHTGAEATPAAYTAAGPRQFAYIHFVAHATADEMNPLNSAIVLSRSPASATGQPVPYKLYAKDILKQPIDAELVTLSSCYGSGRRDYTGEGVVGLVWAFLRAGAHSVIGALWEVSDVSTPRLMDTLYGELLRGSSPDAALRTAKLKMVRERGVFRKPLYWGAFQLYAGR